ncbi:sigma-70 family RNA polymerase sigma factor [Sandarakinorhabdus rubra]|uniref:sigma-70 family RNA polymerase sigma factor n=1 Tax=Sandarakinorhabdus rubra TaxID=2672568 RepID=UPI001F1958D9|nr:sigma-70 family RNA polymerase sigma factor [Sandarakinorhabdus rubra]
MQRLADAGHSDDELMALCASGDARAFRCLFDRHGQSAWRLAWRLTGDAVEAEDLVQEGFARLWKQAGHWQGGQAKGGTGAGAFLQRAITNLAIDRSRRKRPDTMADLPEGADPAPLADALLESADLSARIQASLASLPDRQRAAIVLTYWEGLTGPMAADVMDLSPKAFESLLVRARSALKSVLAAAGIDTSLLPGDAA